MKKKADSQICVGVSFTTLNKVTKLSCCFVLTHRVEIQLNLFVNMAKNAIAQNCQAEIFSLRYSG